MQETQIRNVRRYSDVHFKLSISDGGVPISWDTTTVRRLFMFSEKQRGFGGKCTFQVDDDPHYLNVTFPSYDQQFLGIHRVVAQVEIAGNVATYDARVCNLVASTSNVPVVYDEVIDVPIEVSAVDTTVLFEILAACRQATDEATEAAEKADGAFDRMLGGNKNEVLTKLSNNPLDIGWKPSQGGGGSRPYVSLERQRPYLYRVTFDTLPEPAGDIPPVIGGCSAFVWEGRLRRNMDFKYDPAASFIVRTRDFEGMSFITGLNDGELDDDLIAQLPYRMVDGRNNNGIMVSAHVLFNDWRYTGAGSKTIAMTRLPFEVLTRVKSMDTIAADLSPAIGNLAVTSAMGDYLIQMLITDGETTYALIPPEADGLGYVLVDATANPKMSNFRWVADTQVDRADLQERPTGVERWNLMPCPLSELRFTAAYESPDRLSEFIGIGGTTKDSTDADLEAVYDLARAEYLTRERDGKTWQTMHSVVYGSRMEDLFIQEDWTDNCAPVAKEYVDEEVARVEAAIPDVSQFITKSVNNLVNYYLKSETYTRAEVQEIINTVKQFVYEAVTELPAASAQTMHKIYLVPSDEPEAQNVRDEFITIDNGVSAEARYTWEQIGSTAIDLSGYYTSQQTDAAISTALTTALANYTTTAALTQLLAGKQDALSEDQLAAVNSGITAPKLTALEQKVGDREATETSMGYVLLDPSKTFSEQVTAEDTIYEIRDNFDLDDDEVEIPTNCVLKFNGGKVSNGILDLNNCFIDSKTLCFNAVLPSDNSLFSQEVNPCWFGAIGDGANDDTDAWLSTIAFAKKINTRGETFRNFGKSQIRIRAEKNQYFRLTSPLLVEGNISIVGGFTFYYDNTGAEYEGAIAFKGNIYNQEYSFSVKNIYQSDTTLYDYDQQGAKFVGIALGSPTNSIGMGLCNFHDIAIIGFHTAISLYGNGGFVYQCIFDQIISTYAIKMFDIISYNRAWHNSNTFRNITMITPSGGYKMPNGVNEAVCFNFYGDGTYVPNSLLFENVHLEGHPLNNSLYKTVPIKEAASALGITRISLWILRNFRCENLNNSHIIISEHSIRLNEGIIFDSAFLGTTNPSFNIAGAIISGGNTKKWGIHVSTDSGNFPSMDISFNDIVSKNKINGTYYFLDNRFPSIDIYGSFAGKTKVTSLGDFSANYAIVLAIKPGQWLSFSRNSTAATMFHLFDSDMQNVLWSDNANIHYNESVFIRAYASTEYVTPQSSGVLNNYNFCNNSNAVYYIAMTLKGDVRVDSNAALEFAEYTPIKTIGTTEDRPLLTQVGPYYEFFDTTLGKRIMVNTSNNAWVNLDGTPLDTSSV